MSDNISGVISAPFIPQSDFIFKSETCEVRLAKTVEEIQKAQALRYRVFYELGNATPPFEAKALKRDFDQFDLICDHLLVNDISNPAAPQAVGNYRLLTATGDVTPDYFYSDKEYDLSPLLQKAVRENLKLMELGRSCTDPHYRSSSVIRLLWRGITAYALIKKADVMFGCASFQGVSPDALADPLSFLYYKHSAPPEWNINARDELYVPMQRKPLAEIDERAAFAALPPLLKGYLRLGAYIGNGAVIDHDFQTTDVLIILPTVNIPERYLDFFAR